MSDVEAPRRDGAIRERPLWAIVPTYNEADGIIELIDALLGELSRGARILIVDDDSPDGTGRIADQLADRHPEVEVLHRPGKLGLGPAYVAGFRRALEAGAGLVLQMDADLSHDPAEIPRLLEAIERADLVLGSRWIAGGRIERWGRRRKAISRWGSRYASVVLGVEVADLTGGFKLFRSEVLESIEFASIRSRGYAFQVEVTYRAIRAGFRVIEVPITFRDRRVGESKMSGAIVLEAAWRVPLMRARP